MVNFKKKIQKLNSDYRNAVRDMVSYMKGYEINSYEQHEYGSLYSTMVYHWLKFCLGYSVELYSMFLEKCRRNCPITEACYKENLPDEPEIQRLWKILQKKQKELEEEYVNDLMESFNGFAQEENYISLNESLNFRPALNKIKNICARLQKDFGLDCYATEDEVTFNNDDDIMSNLVVGKKYNNLKQYLVNVIQIMKLCGRKIMFNTQYDYNSILI